MLARLVLLAAVAIAPVCRAASATIFPVALGPEANLQGEIIGSGGDVGTTYVLSGETRGITFTLTLAEDATHVVERVSIPTRSFDLSIDCDIRSGSAVCVNFIVSEGISSTLATTLPFSPFAVPVSTSGVVPSINTVPESTLGGGSTISATVGGSSSTPLLSTSDIVPSAPPIPSSIASIPSSILSSELPSQSVISASIPVSSTATSPSTPTATLASPSAAQTSTSRASRYFAPNGVLAFAFAAIPWILV